MTDISTFFNSVWGFFNVSVPGTPFTFAQMYFGFTFIGLSISIFKHISPLHIKGSSFKTKNKGNQKISTERKNDEK